jgi:hypothetical protein
METLDGAAFWRANFVLHFHRFDDKQALARFDLVSFLNEDADDFAGHGGEHLLAAFGFEGAVLAAAPGAGIDNFGGKFVKAGLEFE